MSIAPAVTRFRLGPWSAGSPMTPEEFDAAEFEEGWRYQLIHEVLIVSPSPLPQERDPNEELGSMLRVYGHDHPQGSSLDVTLAEETVSTTPNRRRADRVIWAGLGRLPTPDDPPTIIIEFVSEGRANRRRDYETKRDEYRALGVREYWIFDRFDRTLTVVVFGPHGDQVRVLKEDETYAPPLLPRFELPLPRLFALADRWPERLADS
ncbi:MAG: Uma2 family endonuclease [Isosphaeraceae bacterium]